MRHEYHNFATEREKPSRPKYWGYFLLFLVFLFFMTGCLRFLFGSRLISEDPMAYDPVTLDPKPPEGLIKRIGHFVLSRDVTLSGQRKDRINILLLGMGGEGHDGPYLTDTIIVGSVKPSTGQVALVSIPRDLGVKIPGRGVRKINHANAYGEAKKTDWGAAFATEVIEDTFDVDINYYIRLDFSAFKQIIDEVGGITVNVERSFADHTYPADNNDFQTVSFTKGITKMDGDMALKYARSRHGNNGEGSDFARARRQQKMLLALKKKILSFSTLSNPVRLHNIVKTLDKHITTNMEFSDIIAFVRLAREADTGTMKTVVLDSSVNGFLQNGYSPDGAFILESKTGSFKEIRKMIDNIFEEDVELGVEGAPTPIPVQEEPEIAQVNLEIQNGTWRAGLAARMRKRLQDKGFKVSNIGNTEERPQFASGIYDIVGNDDSHELVTALQDELHIPVKQKVPDGLSATSTTEILIILGEDIQE